METFVYQTIEVDGKKYSLRVPEDRDLDIEMIANKIRENVRKAEAEGLTKPKK